MRTIEGIRQTLEMLKLKGPLPSPYADVEIVLAALDARRDALTVQAPAISQSAPTITHEIQRRIKSALADLEAIIDDLPADQRTPQPAYHFRQRLSLVVAKLK